MSQVSDPQPENVFNQALDRHQSGNFLEAESLYRQVLQSNPNDADALQMLGVLSLHFGRRGEALEFLRRAVRIDPGAADYHFHLGVILAELGNSDEAEKELQQTLSLEENFPEAHLGIGKLLQSRGRLDAAVFSLRRAVELRPDLTEAWEHLTDALRDLGRLEEAHVAGQSYVDLRPSSPVALTHLGVVFHYMGRYDEAINLLREAIQLDPAYADACVNLANAFYSAWDILRAIVFYRKSVALSPQSARFHSNLLYTLHFDDELTPAEMFQEHLKWAAAHAKAPRDLPRPHPNDRTASRRLRVGYVSADFRAHSVSFFIENLLANHDPEQIETFCYADTLNPDAVTARLNLLAHNWRDTLGLDDQSVVDLIRQDQIDILVDLAGHTANHRLVAFARKPAPIQLTYLGYPDTTGLEAIDYRLTDAYADPPGSTEQFHTEKLIHLPRRFLCFSPPPDSPDVSPLPALSSGQVTFGSLNHLPKINSAVVELWSQILRGVPRSRILIKSLSGLHFPPTRQKLFDLFALHGIDQSRVILRPGTPSPSDHLKTYHEIDIALDTFPYCGTTTTCEALWMGVPVITLEGKRHAGRVGVSLLSNVGLPELIAKIPQQYEEIATGLTADLPRLGHLREMLREKMIRSPLLDAPNFARDVEAVYRRVWRHWLEA